MKLFGTKKLIDKEMKKNLLSPEVVEVVLVQCNLVDNQHQQKSDILHNFILNKFYSY